MKNKINQEDQSLASEMRGIWWLLSREDWTEDGERRIDPMLGAEPLGILCYAKEYFSAQFMKRNRTGDMDTHLSHAIKNNTAAIAGYDAYFGTYEVNEQTGEVKHTLLGSVNPSNIGMSVNRNLSVGTDRLVIRLQTNTADGEAINRTLTWKRIG